MSQAPRLFVDTALEAGGVFVPSPRQSHYVLNVMRRREGDLLALFNGRDGEWLAVVEAIERRACRLRLQEQSRPQAAEPGTGWPRPNVCPTSCPMYQSPYEPSSSQ